MNCEFYKYVCGGLYELCFPLRLAAVGGDGDSRSVCRRVTSGYGGVFGEGDACGWEGSEAGLGLEGWRRDASVNPRGCPERG